MHKRERLIIFLLRRLVWLRKQACVDERIFQEEREIVYSLEELIQSLSGSSREKELQRQLSVILQRAKDYIPAIA